MNQMKGFVTLSRFTPGLANAVDVALQPGDVCKWQKLGIGPVVEIEIKSTLRQHTNGCFGYEAVFADDGQLAFADERSIVDWHGKP
jgi:hypothetical protein